MNEEYAEKMKKVVNNLYTFYDLFVARDYPEHVYAPHIKELSKELMRLYRGDLSRMTISMPPRFSKSSMVTLAFPMWLIFRNPNTKIFIVNASLTLSEKFGIQLREYIRQYGEYFNVFLSDVKNSKTHLMFQDKDGKLYKGEIRLSGWGGTVTGLDADYLILDDILGGNKDDLTPSALQKKIDTFNLVFEQRLEPNSKLIIMMTRWSEMDLIGYLQEADSQSYKFINYPAILPNGKSLWPQRYSVEELLEKKRRMGEASFNALYQQQPLDKTSDFFEVNKIHLGRPENYNPIIGARGWDIAASDNDGEKNDSTVGGRVILSYDKDTYSYDFICDSVVWGQFGKLTKSKVVSQSRLDGLGVPQLIETGVAAAGKLLFEEWKNQLKPYPAIQMKPVKSKVDRAMILKNRISDGKFYLALDDKDLERKVLKQLSGFPFMVHDDCVDALAYAVMWLDKHTRRTTRFSKGGRIG